MHTERIHKGYRSDTVLSKTYFHCSDVLTIETSFEYVLLLFLFSGPTTMTRAAYARLSSAGFPSIVDRRGNPPQVIDPKEELPLHLDTEGMDQLLGNEIIIQFLALSRYGSFHASLPPSILPTFSLYP